MEFLKLSSQKSFLVALCVLLLSSCTIFNPYVDRRRNPGVADVAHLYSGPSKPDAPVICYNPLFTGKTKLQEIADAECIKQGTGNYAEFDKKTYFDGKLLLPNHAHYKCVIKRNEKE